MIKVSRVDLEKMIAKSNKQAIDAFIEASLELDTRENESITIPQGMTHVGVTNVDLYRHNRHYPVGSDVYSSVTKSGNVNTIVVSPDGNAKIAAKYVDITDDAAPHRQNRIDKASTPSPSKGKFELPGGNTVTVQTERNWTWFYFTEAVLADNPMAVKIKTAGGKFSGRRTRQQRHGCVSAYYVPTKLDNDAAIALLTG
jgi:hypothetical protein